MGTPFLYTLGQLLPLAVVVSLSPLPVIAGVLLLTSPTGRSRAPLFLVARMLALTILLAIVVAASDALYALYSAGGLPIVLRLLIGAALNQLQGLHRINPRTHKPLG